MSFTFLPYGLYLFELVAKAIVIGLVLGRRKGTTQSRLTWIIVVLAIPLVGIALYILIGEIRLGRSRIARHRTILDRIQSTHLLEAAWAEIDPVVLEGTVGQMSRLAEAVGNCRPRGGNQLQIMAESGGFVSALVEAIDGARDHCHLLFYIYLTDASGSRVAEALARAAARGVRCRLLVDSVGSSAFLRSAMRSALEQAGVVVVEALPAHGLRLVLSRIDLRNHRKIVIIDGSIGFLGSQNIADAAFAVKPRFAPWVDTMVRLEGPAVRDLQVLFIEDWYLDTNESLEELLAMHHEPFSDGVTVQIMGTGPGFGNEALRQLLQAATHAAREELIMTTPYFVPDDASLAAIRTAALRGVETTLIVPARNDSPLVALASRGLYEPLLEAGVRLHEFTEGLLHAKTTTIDKSLALISSANLDRRSFELNFEVSMVVYDSDFASHMRFVQQSYLERSRRIDLATWRERPVARRIVENAAGTLSPLL